jgi:hypothetical protein
MRWSACLAVLALTALVATSSTGVAQTAADTARNWGLLGSWRRDCSRKASQSNPDLRYVVRGGKLYHERNFGDSRDSNLVITATATPDGALELVVNFGDSEREYAFVHGGESRIRAMFNRNVGTDEYSIRDGRLTAANRPVPWQYRCKGG